MPVSDPHKRNLRLPRELATQVKTEAVALGISENDYLILAAREKVTADKARRTQDGESQKRGRSSDAPRGLGLRLEPVTPAAPRPAPELAPPVVVNVGTPSGAAPATEESGIGWLVAHVRDAPAWERERRLRQAREIIRSACTAPAARKAAEDKLDEALAEKKNEGRWAPSGSIGSLFR